MPTGDSRIPPRQRRSRKCWYWRDTRVCSSPKTTVPAYRSAIRTRMERWRSATRTRPTRCWIRRWCCSIRRWLRHRRSSRPAAPIPSSINRRSLRWRPSARREHSWIWAALLMPIPCSRSLPWRRHSHTRFNTISTRRGSRTASTAVSASSNATASRIVKEASVSPGRTHSIRVPRLPGLQAPTKVSTTRRRSSISCATWMRRPRSRWPRGWRLV